MMQRYRSASSRDSPPAQHDTVSVSHSECPGTVACKIGELRGLRQNLGASPTHCNGSASKERGYSTRNAVMFAPGCVNYREKNISVAWSMKGFDTKLLYSQRHVSLAVERAGWAVTCPFPFESPLFFGNTISIETVAIMATGKCSPLRLIF
jgi:hypothetical protein